MTDPLTLGDAERAALAAAMDRLVPPIDDLPGAGTMGLAEMAVSLATRHAPYHRALGSVTRKLVVSGFVGRPGPEQDAWLRDLEASDALLFSAVLSLVYLAYYGDVRVQRRIGWRAGPLQPSGFALASFDEAVVDKVRRRPPLWRPPG